MVPIKYRESANTTMEIVLVRHARPDCKQDRRLSSIEFKDWLKAYDLSGIEPMFQLSEDTKAAVKDIGAIHSSSTLRSIETANRIHQRVNSDDVFCEAPFPVYRIFRKIKLIPRSWMAIYRCLWLCGFSKDVETFKQTRKRAKKAATVLVKDAVQQGKSMLVAHGFINILIAYYLRKQDWIGPAIPKYAYTGCSRYVKER